jgi:hypothetical protein
MENSAKQTDPSIDVLTKELRTLVAGVVGPHSPKLDRLKDILAAGAEVIAPNEKEDAVEIALGARNWAVVETILATSKTYETGDAGQKYADKAFAAGAPPVTQALIFKKVGVLPHAEGGVVLPAALRNHAEHAMVSAAGAGDADRVRYLAGAGVDINCKHLEPSRNGRVLSSPVTPLVAACRANQTEAALAALELGANPLISTATGLTAAFFATQHENNVVLEPIMEATLLQMETDDLARKQADEVAAREVQAKADHDTKMRAAYEAEKARVTKAELDGLKAQQAAYKASLKSQYEEVPKRGRGRPPGTQNKPKAFPSALREPTPKGQPVQLLHPVDVAVGKNTEASKESVKIMARAGDKKAIVVAQMNLDFGV